MSAYSHPVYVFFSCSIWTEHFILMPPATGKSKSSSGLKESCLQCSKTLLPSFMRKHVLEEHCAPEKRTCSVCGTCFKAKNILNRHKRQYHSTTGASIGTATIGPEEAPPARQLTNSAMEGGSREIGDHIEAQPQIALFGAPTIEQLQTPRGALTSPSQYYSGATPFVGLSLPSQLQGFQAFISSESQREQVLLFDLI
jgi:hypothetical protein